MLVFELGGSTNVLFIVPSELIELYLVVRSHGSLDLKRIKKANPNPNIVQRLMDLKLLIYSSWLPLTEAPNNSCINNIL